ncbi:MAG: hypothetical protein JWN62_808 [Acidimicrobiales bacterium]|nr:hypothetical protein [Acidimicrobiales bacterium]
MSAPTASRQLISADSHINEPPDLWISRVPAEYRARAPRVEHLELGDAWIVEGALDPINFGGNCSAGIPADERSAWIRWEQVRPGGYEPVARLLDQDADRVAAEVLYPTPRLANQLFWSTTDRGYHLACVRAYNDWLSEFCGHDPSRLWGVAMIPNVGVDDAIAELDRISADGTMRGILLGRYPSGDEAMTPDDDRFWARAEELDLPVSIHVSFATEAQGDKKRMKLTGDMRFFDAPIRAAQFINGGVFDRFPGLHLVLVEVDVSWIPYVKEQMDDRFLRAGSATRAPIAKLPSDYFAENIFATFVTDRYGMANRHAVGVSQILWSTDFPHGGSDWPNSRTTATAQLDGVPDDEAGEILAGNALRLYAR